MATFGFPVVGRNHIAYPACQLLCSRNPNRVAGRPRPGFAEGVWENIDEIGDDPDIGIEIVLPPAKPTNGKDCTHFVYLKGRENRLQRHRRQRPFPGQPTAQVGSADGQAPGEFRCANAPLLHDRKHQGNELLGTNVNKALVIPYVDGPLPARCSQ